MWSDTVPEGYVDCTNASRNDPVEHQYKGAERMQKLKELQVPPLISSEQETNKDCGTH